jgi:2-haloalkanoic acid dehalogenase type II
MRLTDFKILTFDCYGTLIDWETGMVEALQPLAERADRPLTRDQILEAHGRHEAAQQLTTPTKLYRDVLAVVYKRLAEEWDVHVAWDECVAYGLSVRDWPAFDDTATALQYLAGHFRLAILSNVDNETFDFSNRKLGVYFDAIFTAEDIGSYKPSPRNFEYMIDKLGGMGIEKSDILHTAESMFHDHAPANAIGLANCWIHRRHEKEGFGATMKPEAMPTCDFRYVSLADFADAHRRTLAEPA